MILTETKPRYPHWDEAVAYHLRAYLELGSGEPQPEGLAIVVQKVDDDEYAEFHPSDLWPQIGPRSMAGRTQLREVWGVYFAVDDYLLGTIAIYADSDGGNVGYFTNCMLP